MANSNMYTASAAEIWDLFDDYVEGAPSGCVVALSTLPLGADARNALEKSMAAFGYGERALSYATLLPRAGAQSGEDDGGNAGGNEAAGAGAAGAALGAGGDAAALDAQAEFLLIEGLDPICLIACDDRAIASLEATYRTTCKRDAAEHVFCRPCVLFGDFEKMLATERGKQRAWSLLKTLPRMA